MVFCLDKNSLSFPDPALADDDGLLAIGGDLGINRLLTAYSLGIFPWYDEESPILWYSPHQRFVLRPSDVHISKSMQKVFRCEEFTFSYNLAFKDVIKNCSSISRKDQFGTWIVEDMISAYISLYELGYAHSIEVWKNNNLVGGLYGVLVGRVFCGESMFSKVSNASKAALIYLATKFDLELIDCQIYSDHLDKMGAKSIPQSEFSRILSEQTIEASRLDSLLL